MRLSHLLRAFGLLALGMAVPASAAPFGTAFTYQGALRDAGAPASGVYDLQFTPYGVASDGSALAPPLVLEDVVVAEGIFTAQVDFGPSFFVGDEVFLEIAVRAGSSTGGFTPLAPRQSISAVPYAQKVRVGSVSSIELAPGAVTGPSLGTDAVGPAAIAANAVGTSEIADSSIAAADLGTGSVGADEIATDAVGINEISPDAVDTIELVDGAVATAKLEDLSVTRAKIAPGAVGATEVDASVIQLRPSGTCPSGLPLLGFDATGAIYCSHSARTIDVGVSGDEGIDVALRSDDRPVVAYSYGFGLRIQACDDAFCTSGTPYLITSAFDAGPTASIVTRSNDVALVSYVDSIADSLNLHVCTGVSCPSSTTRILADVGAITLPTSIAFAGTTPIVAYAGIVSGETSPEVRLFVCNAHTTCGSGGTVRVLDTSATNLAGLALAVRPSLRPLVAYAEAVGVGDSDLRLYDCADASCSTGTTRTLDGASDSAGEDVAIAIRPDGRPILAYFYGSASDLRLFDCADVDCLTGTVRSGETSGSVGTSTSIAIRADGRPVVTSYQQSGGGVRFWDCADVNCTSGTARSIDPLDSAGQRGTSVALRSDGRPVVSYLSLSGARTRVHICGRTDCATSP